MTSFDVNSLNRSDLIERYQALLDSTQQEINVQKNLEDLYPVKLLKKLSSLMDTILCCGQIPSQEDPIEMRLRVSKDNVNQNGIEMNKIVAKALEEGWQAELPVSPTAATKLKAA